MQYVKKKGIHYEKDYPYNMSKSKFCRRKRIDAEIAPKIIRNIGHVKRSEEAIYERLRYGPLKIAVYASSDGFQHYKSGYITPETCLQQFVNHAVS